MRQVSVHEIAAAVVGARPELRLLALFPSDVADRVEVEPATREPLPKAA